MALVWSDEYVTGIAEIDQQHKAIFREMGSLAMSLLQGKNYTDVQRELIQLALVLRDPGRLPARGNVGSLGRSPTLFAAPECGQ